MYLPLLCIAVFLTAFTSSKADQSPKEVGLKTDSFEFGQATFITNLSLSEPTKDRNFSHFTSASGIQIVDDKLYIISDDENFLGTFSIRQLGQKNMLGTQAVIFPNLLPVDNKLRKKKKSDWEAITALAPNTLAPHGGLLLIPSGSTKHRTESALFPFDKDKNLAEPLPIDFSEFYKDLATKVTTLNIEGIVANTNEIKFFNRSSTGEHNAVITLSIEKFLNITNKANNQTKFEYSIRHYALKNLSGVPLGFSDATALKDGSILFIASAEATDSAYSDGKIAGSSLGYLDNKGTLLWIKPFVKGMKAEGITAQEQEDGKITLFVVFDQDDPNVASQMHTYTYSKDELLKVHR